MTVRTTIGMIALSATAAFGCNNLVGPAGPAPVDPPTQAVVAISVFGTQPDPDGHEVVLRAEDGEEIATRQVATDGGAVRFEELAPGSYAVAVEGITDDCLVEGDTRRLFTVREGRIARIEFEVSCPGPEVIAEYRRTSPEDLSERYFLNEDSAFMLDNGPGEWTGTHSLVESGTEIVFDFDGFSSRDGPDAIGTLEGDCMTVEYSLEMALSDFQGGEFCR